MRMRLIILFIPGLIFAACNSSSKSPDKKTITGTFQKSAFDSTLYNSKKLIGEWGIFVTISEGVETTCNVCPKIKFNPDHSAAITKPSGQIEKIKWEINGSEIVFDNTYNIINEKTFSRTEYEMTFRQGKGFIELMLTQLDKKYSYILRQ